MGNVYSWDFSLFRNVFFEVSRLGYHRLLPPRQEFDGVAQQHAPPKNGGSANVIVMWLIYVNM